MGEFRILFFSVCVCVCVCVCVLPPTNAFTTAFHLESLSQAPLPPCPWRLNENFIYRVFEFEIISIYKKQSFYTSATYSFIYLFDICPFSLFPYAISSFQGWKVRVFFNSIQWSLFSWQSDKNRPKWKTMDKNRLIQLKKNTCRSSSWSHFAACRPLASFE